MPINTPIAIISGSAGTIAPKMMMASENAIKNTSTPAASGWALIQARVASNQALCIGGL